MAKDRSKGATYQYQMAKGERLSTLVGSVPAVQQKRSVPPIQGCSGPRNEMIDGLLAAQSPLQRQKYRSSPILPKSRQPFPSGGRPTTMSHQYRIADANSYQPVQPPDR